MAVSDWRHRFYWLQRFHVVRCLVGTNLLGAIRCREPVEHESHSSQIHFIFIESHRTSIADFNRQLRYYAINKVKPGAMIEVNIIKKISSTTVSGEPNSGRKQRENASGELDMLALVSLIGVL
ncbi:uncharacterized protein LOC129773531 [Toxorhynchites rutilus septentrionalis]|uniref:uncharacterized protein LOC129773531 n=1 Tax=Toxorhynchites rutilus septentrionalis TaxID=329112 RepID=UPI00247A56F4|nr:uncharacterized protein LOC129773531 [Toxorhynchites rutilus septentrionalis]